MLKLIGHAHKNDPSHRRVYFQQFDGIIGA